MKLSFLKRSLLLSVASAAVLSGPALADDLTISSATKNAVKTSSANNGAGDITIDSNGSITVKQAGPVVTLDSSNVVTLSGNISNQATDGAAGIVVDTGTHDTAATVTDPDSITGSLNVLPTNGDLSSGDGTGVLTVNLSGSGSGKAGLAIIGNGKFGGDINFGNALTGVASMAVQGDNSAGISMASTAILNGDLNIAAQITMSPTTANETNATGISAVNLGGTIMGNVLVDTGSQLVSYGNGSVGFVSSGTIQGSFTNSGVIAVQSFQTSQNQSTGEITVAKGTGDPVGGPAMIINGSILGGFMNSGPDGTNAATTPATGTITTDSGGASPLPIVYISPSSTSKLEIGVFSGDTANPGYSFYNRGSIFTASAGTVDPNLSVSGVVFSGTSATSGVQLDGNGFFNSGTIAIAGHTTSKGTSAITVVGLGFGSLGLNDVGTGANGGFVTVGSGDNSGLYNSGTITASASGDLGATVIGVDIGSTSVLKSIVNSGTIQAVGQTNNPTTSQTETAVAIIDQSGTLSSITNSGTISATVTQITAGTPIQVAADLSHNTTGVTFDNSGSVIGDVRFGSGTDKLTVGNLTGAAQLIGNIDFGGVDSHFTNGRDTLDITDHGFVSGQIHEAFAGMLDIHVSGAGTLNLQNNSVAYGSLLVDNLTVDNHGTLNIAASTVLPRNVSIDAGTTGSITLADGADVAVIYSSFIPADGQFTLMQAAHGNLHISDNEFGAIKTEIDGDIPFLFNTNGGLQRVTSGSLDQIVLSLTPKSSGQLGLTGYAAQVFPYANAALGNDDSLGAAMIAGVTSNATAQTAYSQFAPDASGGTRAIAISLTDHATGPVAARQRALRLYATQPGDLTLWGQEFAQQISDKGSNGLPGFKDSGFGFAMGADGGDALGGWYGGAFTFYTGNVDQRAPASSRDNTQWYMLSGYSTWRGKGLFLDTQLTAGYGDLSAHRFIVVGSAANNTLIGRQADSKRSSVMAAVGMTTGANLVYGSTTITPNIALDGLTMREEGYTETGGGGTTGDGFDLHVDPVEMGSLRGFVGLNARQDVNFGGFFLQPELRVGYRYDFLADRIDLTASFPGVTGTGPGTGEFTVTGPKPAKGNVVAGASVATTTGAWSIGLNYDMLSGSNGSMTQVGTVSLVGRI